MDEIDPVEVIEAAVNDWLARTQLAGWHDGGSGKHVAEALSAAGLSVERGWRPEDLSNETIAELSNAAHALVMGVVLQPRELESMVNEIARRRGLPTAPAVKG